MKIHLKNQEKFNKETIVFYKNNFDIVDEKDADILVVNDFNPIEAPDKIVACNATCCDHIKAKEVISLSGEDLSDLTAVAELTLAMAIYCTRIFKGEEVKNKSLLVIGVGRIGTQLLKYARSVGMYPFVIDTDNLHQLDEMLGIADIVSLHITASEENLHFMDKKKFDIVKDGAIFLNSARPWLVEEEGLKWALDNKLAGAWEDFEGFKHNKIIRTPHSGGSTVESKKKSELILANKLFKLYGTK